jgi:hypothetical protein
MISRARTAATIATSETSAMDMRARKARCTDARNMTILGAEGREEISMMSVIGHQDAAPTMTKKIEGGGEIKTETTMIRHPATAIEIHQASNTAPNPCQQ